jgi:hypothetical protein
LRATLALSATEPATGSTPHAPQGAAGANYEPIIMARKPLTGTVAQSVLAHGTGALNIDATRVGEGGQLKWEKPRDMGYHGGTDSGPVAATQSAQGRWPTNVVLDEAAAGELDDAARYFPVFKYQAKAPTRERPSYVKDDGTKVAHPTVKPVALMRWLVRLVTPAGGTVLDPFAGSGATVEAALLEGFDVIGIEREADYLPLIMQRIHRATPAPVEQDGDEVQPALFDVG